MKRNPKRDPTRTAAEELTLGVLRTGQPGPTSRETAFVEGSDKPLRAMPGRRGRIRKRQETRSEGRRNKRSRNSPTAEDTTNTALSLLDRDDDRVQVCFTSAGLGREHLDLLHRGEVRTARGLHSRHIVGGQRVVERAQQEPRFVRPAFQLDAEPSRNITRAPANGRILK